MEVGFIRDMLEIKFLILYIAARLSEPADSAAMQDLTMCDDGIDYFDYAECLNDLVKTEHLRLTEDGRYLITEKGKRNSAICESSLPYSVRQRSDRNIAAYNRAALRRAQVQSHVTERENGTFTVTLALRDDVDSLMRLELMVADKDSADTLAKRFQKEPEALYAKVIQALCGE
mgnify:FL=1